MDMYSIQVNENMDTKYETSLNQYVDERMCDNPSSLKAPMTYLSRLVKATQTPLDVFRYFFYPSKEFFLYLELEYKGIRQD